jgi:hypothetical protein
LTAKNAKESRKERREKQENVFAIFAVVLSELCGQDFAVVALEDVISQQ